MHETTSTTTDHIDFDKAGRDWTSTACFPEHIARWGSTWRKRRALSIVILGGEGQSSLAPQRVTRQRPVSATLSDQ